MRSVLQIPLTRMHVLMAGDVSTPIEAQRCIEKPATNHLKGDATFDGHVSFF